MSCIIKVVSNNVQFDVLIDFADNDLRMITMKDNQISLNKSYILPNTYNVSVTILNNNLTNFFVVYSNLTAYKKASKNVI